MTSRRIRNKIAIAAVALALVAVAVVGVLWVLPPVPGPLQVTSPSLLFASTSDARIVLGNSHGSVSWTLRSRSGEKISTGTNAGGPDAVIAPPVPRDGYYTLEVADNRDSLTVNFLVSPRPQTTDAFFSVATHWGKSSFAANTWPIETTAPLLRDLGFSEIRDETSWMSVEKAKGERSIPSYAADLHTVTDENGLRMLFVAGYGNPAAYPDDMTGVLSPPTSAEARRAYVSYINTVLDADPRIDKVEVWNEFNRAKRNTSDCLSGDCYADLVKAVYTGVKSQHPEVKIIAGNTSGTPLPWFTDFINAGGLRYCDMLSTHGYARDLDTTLAQVRALDALVKRKSGGVAKPIVVSEIGVSNTTSTARSGNIARVRTEAQAAAALVKIFVGLRSVPSVSQVVWYDGIDDGTRLSETEDNFGLYRQPTDSVTTFQPKEAAAAAGYLMRQLEGYTFISRDEVGPAVSSYTFADARGNERRILWRQAPYDAPSTSVATVSVETRPGYRTSLSSVTGEVIDDALPLGLAKVSVGNEPVFLDEVPKGL